MRTNKTDNAIRTAFNRRGFLKLARRVLSLPFVGCTLMVFGAFSTTFSQTTNTCFFVGGPKTGSTQSFPQFPPIPLGSACNDGMGSFGLATPDGQRQPMGRFGMNDGQPSCVDIIQAPVPYRANEAIPKSGLATFDEFGRPVIFLRQSQLPGFSPPVRTFLFAHECGHHALGQVRAGLMFRIFIGPPMELGADCFAMSELRRLRLINDTDVATILQFLSTVPGDPTTFPGPERVQRLRRCMT